MCLSSALSKTQFEKKRKQWKEGIIDKQQEKEEDLTQGNNWRGITLFSVLVKIIYRIMLHTIKKKVYTILRNEQSGLMK